MEHSVNVLHFAEARASEIASMMDSLHSSKKKLAYFQRLPHYMRRRAASQNPKRVPKKLQEANKQGQSKVHKKYKKKNKQGKFAHKDSHYTWLETHIWHAKRFKMETLWGYRVPIHANDGKIGTSHRGATKRCIVQDLSYYCCIQLEGPQNKLISDLSSLLNPKCGFSFDSSLFLDGSKEGHCFLFHPNSSPLKAIGPVTFLWEPQATGSVKRESRKLWIWCHPSFHDELVSVFTDVFHLTKQAANNDDDSKYTFACKLNLEKTKHHFLKEDRYASSTHPFTMTLLRNTLARHRLVGPTASQVLARVMRIADVDKLSSSSATLKSEDGSTVKKIKRSDTYWWGTYYADNEGNKKIHGKQKKVLDSLKNIECHSYIDPWSVVSLTVRDPRCGHHWSESSSTSEDSESSVPPSNMGSLSMADVAVSPLWDHNIRNEVTATKMSEMELNEEKGKCVVAPDLGDKENRVPVILIHRPHLNGMGYGWDIIAPLGWSLEFWRGYAKSGSLATGLRDLRFVNLEAGHPNFPRSFPDTAAGKQEQLSRQAQGFSELHRHPKTQRPNFTAFGVPTPFTVHWEVLLKDCVREFQKFDSFPQALRKSVTEKVADSDDFYVLKELHELSRFCFCAKKAGKSSEPELQKLLQDIDSFVENALVHESVFFKSLVLVKIDCLNKGTPFEHAGLYLLSAEDMVALKESWKFPGPVEPTHPHKEGKTQNKKDAKPKNTDSLEKSSKIDSYIGSCSRKMIGYISEGCFSSACGRGIGIGHCTSIGFITLLKQCAESCMKPVVLFRNQNTYQFRVANIELIEDFI